MTKNIKKNVYWVGKNDPDIKMFHGHEYSTKHGTSYNSYLIKEEKTVLIDTVWDKYSQDFISNLKKEIDLEKIDYIVINHAEPDHAGSLGELMKLIPETPIYCTRAGVSSIKGHFHEDWNFQVVKTGDELGLGGGKKLVFIEAPLLHWPDSMFCYLAEDKILFPNDAFGEHLSAPDLFDNTVDQETLEAEALKYYANILAPFSDLVQKKLAEIEKMQLPIEIICPSHGVVWKDNPGKIVELYKEWSNLYQEPLVSIVYETMYGSTKEMAEHIKAGIEAKNKQIKVEIFDSATDDKNDIITKTFKSCAVIFGSPTVNNTVLASQAALLEMLYGLKLKNKKFAAFGSYGWSGESTVVIEDKLTAAGFEKICSALKVTWRANQEQKEKCFSWGEQIAKQL